MYYVRQFHGGGGEYDARRKLWGVFHCDACGNEEWVHIPQPNLFRYDKIIQCPKCNSYGKDDRVKALTTKKAQLEQEEMRVRAEIEAVIKELDTIKEAV